jgi:hypothetical protein
MPTRRTSSVGEGAARQPRLQRLSVDELHHDDLSRVQPLEAVDGGDVRVVERGEDLRFAGESRDAIRIMREAVGQELQGDIASQPRIAASRTGVALLFMAVLTTAPANAESILFSTLGPGDAFDVNAASFFGFDEGEEGDPDSRFARAMPFSPSSTAALTSLDLALDFTPNIPPGTLVINLFAAEGALPGLLLETFTRTEPLAPGVYSFSSLAQPVLHVGQDYFIEATTSGRGFGGWFFSSVIPEEHARGLEAFRIDNGPWRRLAAPGEIVALRVTGDAAPVPEPASVILVGTAVALVRLRRSLSPSSRRRVR